MNKNDLVAAVAERGKLTRAYATDAIDAVFAVIKEAVEGGDQVRITNFGTFSLSIRAPRTGRNPKTNEVIQIGETRSIKFSPSKKR